jgi:hypothetical protein
MITGAVVVVFAVANFLPGVGGSSKDIYITIMLKHYYSRETGCLYVLNMNELETGDVEFEILKYPIR